MQPAHNLLFNQVKAGLGYVDPDQISHKITEVSKDTKYYQKQKERSKEIDHQIDDLKLKLQFAKKSDLSLAKIQVESFIKSLEKKRNTDQVIFHADLDAFFASVEVINDPSLAGIPFAVGGSIKHGVISTSSYEARKFGVRSGMAVFIALSLCPQLRIVSPSGRYPEFSEKVQSEFSYYDPNYISFGLDEASMNVTEYLKKTSQSAVEVAKEIQEKVFNKTKLTISIGIGPTNQLAKIASDINKPNGVYEVPRDLDEMLNFIRSLPVRKIPGVGGVTERKLQELNFIKIGDILDRREEVWFLFSQSFCKFIFSSALGIQYLAINQDERKSISTEETFEATNDVDLLIDKVERMAEKLALKLQKNSMRCKTVTVKFKTHDFQNITQQITFKQDTSKISDIQGAAMKILMDEHRTKHYKLRLIGVRVSNLVYKGEKIQKAISDWINNSEVNNNESSLAQDKQIFEKDDIDEKAERNNQPDFSIKRYFEEGSNIIDDNNDSDFQFESENLNQLTINNEDTNKDSLKYSIERFCQKGKIEILEQNIQINNDDNEIPKEKTQEYPIKRYFQESEHKTILNNFQNKEDIPKLNNQDIFKKNTNFSIKSYFNNGNNQTQKKFKIKDESRKFENNEISNIQTNSFFQNIREESSQSENETPFKSSSDYDDSILENDKYLVTTNFISKKIGKSEKAAKEKKKVNTMKKIIESYFPERVWESEEQKFNHPPKWNQKSSKIKQKTKEGTFMIGSFFDKTPSPP